MDWADRICPSNCNRATKTLGSISFGDGAAGVGAEGLDVGSAEVVDWGGSATAAFPIREIFCRMSEFIVIRFFLALQLADSHWTERLVPGDFPLIAYDKEKCAR